MSNAPTLSIRHVTVIGGGLMGAGIAEVSAAHGFLTTVVEVSEVAAQRARTNVERHLRQQAKRRHRNDSRAAERFYAEAVRRLSYTVHLAAAVRGADLVVEAIVEELRAKHELFARVDKFAPPGCVLVSNTSSLSINGIASVLPAARRRHFAGLHFFAPVALTQIVEIIRCADTGDDTHAALESFVAAIDKQHLTCKDTPGFVVNGLLIPYVAGGVRMVETGVATAADVDRAMRLALFHPMGPLQVADFIGLDVCDNITSGMALVQPENPLYQGRLMREMVERGELGRKSGKGFYEYAPPANGAKSKL